MLTVSNILVIKTQMINCNKTLVSNVLLDHTHELNMTRVNVEVMKIMVKRFLIYH